MDWEKSPAWILLDLCGCPPSVRTIVKDANIVTLKELSQLSIPDEGDLGSSILTPIIRNLQSKTEAELSYTTTKEIKKLLPESSGPSSPRSKSVLGGKIGRISGRSLPSKVAKDESLASTAAVPRPINPQIPKPEPTAKGPDTKASRKSWNSLDVKSMFSVPKRKMIDATMIKYSLNELLMACEDRSNEIGTLMSSFVPVHDFRVLQKQLNETLSLFLVKTADITFQVKGLKSNLDELYELLKEFSSA